MPDHVSADLGNERQLGIEGGAMAMQVHEEGFGRSAEGVRVNLGDVGVVVSRFWPYDHGFIVAPGATHPRGGSERSCPRRTVLGEGLALVGFRWCNLLLLYPLPTFGGRSRRKLNSCGQFVWIAHGHPSCLLTY